MGQQYEDMKTNVTFQGTEYGIRKTQYSHGGRTAIVLWDKQHDEIGFVATVNLPDHPLLADYTFIKNYSENEGMLKILEDAGIVKDTGMRVQSGFVEVPVVELQGRFRDQPQEPEYDPESASQRNKPQDKDRSPSR